MTARRQWMDAARVHLTAAAIAHDEAESARHVGEALAAIPYEDLAGELARRNARKRRTYTGGQFWAKHNPNTSRCRCEECVVRREVNQAGLSGSSAA